MLSFFLVLKKWPYVCDFQWGLAAHPAPVTTAVFQFLRLTCLLVSGPCTCCFLCQMCFSLCCHWTSYFSHSGSISSSWAQPFLALCIRLGPLVACFQSTVCFFCLALLRGGISQGSPEDRPSRNRTHTHTHTHTHTQAHRHTTLTLSLYIRTHTRICIYVHTHTTRCVLC